MSDDMNKLKTTELDQSVKLWLHFDSVYRNRFNNYLTLLIIALGILTFFFSQLFEAIASETKQTSLIFNISMILAIIAPFLIIFSIIWYFTISYARRDSIKYVSKVAELQRDLNLDIFHFKVANSEERTFKYIQGIFFAIICVFLAVPLILWFLSLSLPNLAGFLLFEEIVLIVGNIVLFYFIKKRQKRPKYGKQKPYAELDASGDKLVIDDGYGYSGGYYHFFEVKKNFDDKIIPLLEKKCPYYPINEELEFQNLFLNSASNSKKGLLKSYREPRVYWIEKMTKEDEAGIIVDLGSRKGNFFAFIYKETNKASDKAAVIPSNTNSVPSSDKAAVTRPKKAKIDNAFANWLWEYRKKFYPEDKQESSS